MLLVKVAGLVLNYRNVGEVAASGLGQTTRTLNLLSPETSPEELEAVMNMLQVYLLFLNDAVDCTSDDAEENIERYLNSLNSTMNNLSSAFSKHGRTTQDDANTLSCTELKVYCNISISYDTINIEIVVNCKKKYFLLWSI